MNTTVAPAAANPRAETDPVTAHLLRRLSFAESEALAANARLAKMQETAARATALAEQLKAITLGQEAEIATLKAAAAPPATQPAPAKSTRKK